jgi:phosphohistidine phosphatase
MSTVAGRVTLEESGPRQQLDLNLKNERRFSVKTVFLLRHAKSSWDQPSLDDYDRPLAPRGKKAAPRVGRYLAREGLTPDRVLCSGARRAMQTWNLVSEELPSDIQLEVRDEIYHASPGNLMELIRALPDNEDSVLLVGHNPSFESLALQAARSGDDEALRSLAFKYPTGALAILDFDTSGWAKVEWGTGHLRAFIRPKTLE